MADGMYTDKSGQQVKVTKTATGYMLTYVDGRTEFIGGK